VVLIISLAVADGGRRHTSSSASACFQSVYTVGLSPDLTPMYMYLCPPLLGPASAQGWRMTGPSLDMRLGNGLLLCGWSGAVGALSRLSEDEEDCVEGESIPSKFAISSDIFYRPCVTPCAKVRLLFGTERVVCVCVSSLPSRRACGGGGS